MLLPGNPPNRDNSAYIALRVLAVRAEKKGHMPAADGIGPASRMSWLSNSSLPN